MKIKCHKGKYEVKFVDNFYDLSHLDPKTTHILISPHVAEAYSKELEHVLKFKSVIHVSSAEENKALAKIPYYCRKLLNNGIKRNHTLICIGGGVTQDVTSFVAHILFRGIDWVCWPTTLLSMADSCIGSKNSLQIGRYKNQVGTYNPPKQVVINTVFIKSLHRIDTLNGIGEMLKVHALHSPKSFDLMASSVGHILVGDMDAIEKAIESSLKIKKKLIEKDEFDYGPRLVLNYGHSFGHALETASDFKIPHGIAVMIGCGMANAVSYTMGIATKYHTGRMNNVFLNHSNDYYEETGNIILRKFMRALRKDKKNRNEYFRVVLPDENAKIKVFNVEDTPLFRESIKVFLGAFKENS